MKKLPIFLLAIVALVSCVSEEERQRITDEQHVQDLLQRNYYWKNGDSIMLDLKDRGYFTDESYEIVHTYKHTMLGIWESTYGDLVKLGDSLSKVMDTIPSIKKHADFAFDVPEKTTWRDFRKTFSKKGYSLHEIVDETEPQFIKNPDFRGSGCPLKENPNYLRIVPSSIIKTNPEEYRKVDPESGFVYLYSNHFKQNMLGKVGDGYVELDFFGDSLLALEYYLYETPDLHDLFVEKYGTPVYDRTESSTLNGSDSINLMIWEYQNMRIKYIGYLRTSSYGDKPHSARVLSLHKGRAKASKEYAPLLAAKQHEDSEKWWKEQEAEQKRLEEERKAWQDKAYKDAI